MNNQPERIAISIDQAAKLSGIGRTTLYGAIKSGRLSAKKFGRRTLIAVDDLRAFIDGLPAVGKAV